MKDHVVSTRLEPETLTALRAEAAKMDVPFSKLIRLAVKRWLYRPAQRGMGHHYTKRKQGETWPAPSSYSAGAYRVWWERENR